jgi:hypothetical protein
VRSSWSHRRQASGGIPPELPGDSAGLSRKYVGHGGHGISLPLRFTFSLSSASRRQPTQPAKAARYADLIHDSRARASSKRVWMVRRRWGSGCRSPRRRRAPGSGRPAPSGRSAPVRRTVAGRPPSTAPFGAAGRRQHRSWRQNTAVDSATGEVIGIQSAHRVGVEAGAGVAVALHARQYQPPPTAALRGHMLLSQDTGDYGQA